MFTKVLQINWFTLNHRGHHRGVSDFVVEAAGTSSEDRIIPSNAPYLFAVVVGCDAK